VDISRIFQALLSVAGISTGQLLLKMAAMNLVNAEAIGFWFLGFRINIYLMGGLMVLGASTLLWIWVLRGIPLSMAYPVMALAFVIVPILSFFILGEALSWKILLGSLLIGAGLITIYS
jgi:drug/metabolite transporter (DMT)-like permease